MVPTTKEPPSFTLFNINLIASSLFPINSNAVFEQTASKVLSNERLTISSFIKVISTFSLVAFSLAFFNISSDTSIPVT